MLRTRVSTSIRSSLHQFTQLAAAVLRRTVRGRVAATELPVLAAGRYPVIPQTVVSHSLPSPVRRRLPALSPPRLLEVIQA